jgi:hypothetical protein
MTPEERQESIAMLNRSIGLANKHGQTLLDDAENSGGVAATTAAIMLSSYCSMLGMTMHEAVDLFMSIHKRTVEMMREAEE